MSKKLESLEHPKVDGDERRQEVALFRFGLIAPVLNKAFEGAAMTYFRKATADPLEVPYAGLRSYSPMTLKGWLRDYRAGGLEALMPSRRSDLGQTRTISSTVEARLRELLTQSPQLSAIKARDILIGEGLITTASPAETTLRRFIRTNSLRALARKKKRERRAWAKRLANELWSLDFMHGPRIGKIKTKLLAGIDDASRYIPLGRFLGSELFVELAPVLRDAFDRHGLPDAIYADNGSAFCCRDLSLVCARLGIALIHSKPYDPESRGKIERFFRTVRGRFIESVQPAALESLDALNHAFDEWLDIDYHRRVHSGIGQTPLACFLEASSPRRWVARQQLDLIFYRTISRKVRKDCTVSINGSRYEVGPEWIGRTIELRSPLDEPSTFILFVQGEPQISLKPLDLIDNDRRNQRARFASTEEACS